LRKFEDLAEDDFRHRLPRFQKPAFNQNLKLVEAVEKIANRKNTSLAQIAISWVAIQGAVPIPGSVQVARVRQNCDTVDLSEEDLKDLKTILDTFPIVGERYGGQQEALLNA
jgi:pyridoxine 4-dehydrogenase